MGNNNSKIGKQTVPSLLTTILQDLTVRHWLVSALAILFIVSSMALAYTSHKTRRLTADWQVARQSHQDQQIRWESLRLELTTLTEADRISNLARKELKMLEVTTKNEKVISL